MSRKDLSQHEKKALLKRISEYPGYSQRQLAHVLNVPKTTLVRLLQKRSEIEGSNNLISRKRQRLSKDDEVDQALLQWFRNARCQDITISGPLLQAKAQDLAHKLGKPEFQVTDGWLGRWKKRHDICYKTAYGEIKDANVPEANHWISTILPEILQEYPPEDIYNCDETAIYYRAAPDGSLTFRVEALSGSKKAMDRITALVCANMAGCDRLPLLVIGKSKYPRCFKGVNQLPVQYKSNKNAWMTSTIFEEWLNDWDNKIGRQKRRIILILDNCSAHPKVNTKNIRLLFLPPNTTCLIQPMDQGIIKNMKTLYRKLVLEMIVRHFDSEDAMGISAIKLSRKISLLSAVQMLATSWASIKQETFVNCFAKAGFLSSFPILPITSTLNAFNDIEVGMAEDEFDNFCSVDNSLQCRSTHEEDQIIEDIISRREDSHHDNNIGCDSEYSEDEVPHIKYHEALECIDKLQLFLAQNNGDECTRISLSKVHSFVSSSNNIRRVQRKITDFIIQKEIVLK